MPKLRDGMIDPLIMQGNALDLSGIEDESVDLVCCSPPYWTLRDNGHPDQVGLEESYDAYLVSLLTALKEMVRKLKPEGSIFINLGDKSAGSGGYNNAGIDSEGRGPKSYIKSTHRGAGQGKRAGEARNIEAHRPAQREVDVPAQSRMMLPWRFAIHAVDVQRLVLRAPIVWHKNCIPQNARDRVEIRHEDVLHFAKRSGCYADTNVIRQWDSVWRIPTKPQPVPPWWDPADKKPAAFPPELARRIILGWCPPGGTVLDPFCGSGTVPMVARTLGRYGIGVDLNPLYVRLARWRAMESPDIANELAARTEEPPLPLEEAA